MPLQPDELREIDVLCGIVPQQKVTLPPLPLAYLLVRGRQTHFLTKHLAQIERMAAQFMPPAAIAVRIGHPPAVLQRAAAQFEDVFWALIGGRARGVDEVSTAMFRAATVEGRTSAARFLLEKRGGYSAKQIPGIRRPSDNLDRVIDITPDNINALAEGQRMLQGDR